MLLLNASAVLDPLPVAGIERVRDVPLMAATTVLVSMPVPITVSPTTTLVPLARVTDVLPDDHVPVV